MEDFLRVAVNDLLNSVNMKNFIACMKINEEACDNIIESISGKDINASPAELSQVVLSPDKTPANHVDCGGV